MGGLVYRLQSLKATQPVSVDVAEDSVAVEELGDLARHAIVEDSVAVESLVVGETSVPAAVGWLKLSHCRWLRKAVRLTLAHAVAQPLPQAPIATRSRPEHLRISLAIGESQHSEIALSWRKPSFQAFPAFAETSRLDDLRGHAIHRI